MPPFPWPWAFDYSPGAIYEIEPDGLYANATLRFCKNFEIYPATYWTLQYGLVPYAGALSGPITFQSAPLNGGNIQLINVLPSITKAWAVGRYTWQCFAQVTSAGATALGIDPSTRYFVSTGTIVVFPDLTQPGAVDTRGKWEKIVDEIEAMLLDTAGWTQQKISMGRGTIAGQSIEGWTKEDLIKFHDYALHMAGNEARIKARRGGAPNPRIKYGVMSGQWNGYAFNGFPSYPPFS